MTQREPRTRHRKQHVLPINEEIQNRKIQFASSRRTKRFSHDFVIRRELKLKINVGAWFSAAVFDENNE